MSRAILFVLALSLAICVQHAESQLKGNLCDMDEPRLKTLMECTLSKSPAGTLEQWENAKAMFNGRTAEQAITAMCTASTAAGNSLLTEFTNQQSKADKPIFKKALKECSS